MQVCEGIAALPEAAGVESIEVVLKNCNDSVSAYQLDERVFGDEIFRKKVGQEIFKGNCALLSL